MSFALFALLVLVAPPAALVVLRLRRILSWPALLVGLVLMVLVVAEVIREVEASNSSTAALGFLVIPVFLVVILVAVVLGDRTVFLVRRVARRRAQGHDSMSQPVDDDFPGVPPTG